MTYNIFIASDHHLGHENVLTFKREDGSPLRPYFSLAEMHEALVANHNSVVRPQDKVYFLGDVMMNKKGLEPLSRMNGTKILIKGNHDVMKLNVYAEHFKDVRSVHPLEKGFVLTHVPIHPQSLERWGTNIHGHLHANNVTRAKETYPNPRADPVWVNEDDPRYFCACIEQINYTPIAFEEIKRIIKLRNQQGE